MRFEYFLAKRFLVGQRFGVFRMVTTAIAIGGTALGVAALLVTLAVMDGFRTDIQEKILGTQPHIVVVQPFGMTIPNNPDILRQLKGVAHVEADAPFINAQALLQTDTKVTGIMLRGIVPDQEKDVTRLSAIFSNGSWQDLDDHSVALGQELATSVGAHLGDVITLIAPQQQTISWTQVPRLRQYKVVALFKSGMYEYDANLAYLNLAAAQDLLGLKKNITGYGIRIDNLDLASRISQKIQQTVGDGLWTRSWEDLNRPLFSAMKLERTVMFIILTLIILVSSFTIISNLLLLTIEKAREIGILQALGASPRQIGKIFLLNGLMLGGSGVGLGLILGTGISGFLKRFPVIQLPADVYYVDRLPIRLSVHTVESVALCAFILVLASILYPAWKARQMDPSRPFAMVNEPKNIIPSLTHTRDDHFGELTLEAQGLVKRFPQGDTEVEILHGISIDLHEGEIVAILGPSGAGKSTLLHLLGLMEHPSAGILKIQGEPVQALSDKQRARLRNEYIGFLFQFHHLLPELTVLENVMLPQRIHGATERDAAAQAAMLLDTIGMRNHLYKKPATLSGGEQQRVALARALVNEPALILADEPTGNLDRETGEEVLRLLWEESRRRNASAVIVTHQEDIAQRADRWDPASRWAHRGHIMKVYIDGQLVEKEKAVISVFDHGLLYGDGVFEGIRAYHGRVFKLREHLDRLFNSGRAIMLTVPMSKKALEEAVLATLRANRLRDAYIRLVVTRGSGDLGLDPRKCEKPTIFIITDKITLYPQEFYEKGLTVITSSVKRNIPEALNPSIKSLNYLNNVLAKAEASRQNAPEAIMLNREGYIAECTGDNIFVVKENTLVTPPTWAGALEGITRNIVMDIAKNKLKLLVKEDLFTPYHVYVGDEVFLTGTAAEVIPVTEVDGRQIGEGKPGKTTLKLMKEFKELTRLTGVPIYEE